MIFINQSVLTLDYKSGAQMRQTFYYVNDSFTNQLAKSGTYKFNTPYVIKFVDPTFIFNSRFNSNFEKISKQYTFRAGYRTEATTAGLYQFYGRYKFANIESGFSTYSFDASYQMAPSTDGVIEFNAPYRYVISDTKFEFSSKYVSHNYIYAANDVDTSIGVNTVDNIITLSSRIPLHRLGLLDYSDTVRAIKSGVIDPYDSGIGSDEKVTYMSFIDIAKYLRANNKTIGVIINNGSKYQNLFIPLILKQDGFIEVPAMYNSFFAIDVQYNFYKRDEFSTDDSFYSEEVEVPEFFIFVRNIDPNRPSTFKMFIADLSELDLAGNL